MTSALDLRTRLNALAREARPMHERDGNDDCGSERQINAANAFHVFVSADLGVNTEDMATAKASSDEMIDEALRRAEECLLRMEYMQWCAERKARMDCLDAAWTTDFLSRWNKWYQWRSWHPRPDYTETRFVSGSCKGQRCYCGAAAEHKVEETVFADDPLPGRHPLTSYVCHHHFREIMGAQWTAP